MFGKIKQTLTGLSERPNLMAALRNLSWLAFDRVFRLGVSFVVTLWLARYLAPELFGVYNYAIAFTALFSVLAALGLQGVVVQLLIDKPDQIGETLTSAFVLQFIGGVVSVLAAIVIAIFLHDHEDNILVAVLSLSAINLFRFADTIRFYFEAKVQSKQLVIFEGAVFSLIVLLRIVFVVTALPLMYFIWLLVLEAFLTAVAFAVLFVKNFDVRKLAFVRDSFVGLLKMAWPLTVAMMATMLYMRTDQVMLASMLGQQAVGIYSASVRLTEIWYVLPSIIVSSVFPRILLEMRSNPDRANRATDMLLFGFAVTSLLVAAAVSMFSINIVSYLFGLDYLEAAPVLSIHIWSSLFVFSGLLSSRWLVAMSMQRFVLISTALGAIVNIGLNYLLIPVYGVSGAAWATLIAQLVSCVLINACHPVSRRFFIAQVSALSLVSGLSLLRWWRLNSSAANSLGGKNSE
ncbi:flippase [Limnobacter profundi]|uniref:Flippase n=1 Tax=Limnobacter profundi TaxID=2732163 RepID=A0ABX6N9N1_9BURK|nr:flippase [Limnobacter sp. SAORIC-580]QJR30758.1 flippase [Limnobacter sp. SAORIC-580]